MLLCPAGNLNYLPLNRLPIYWFMALESIGRKFLPNDPFNIVDKGALFNPVIDNDLSDW